MEVVNQKLAGLRTQLDQIPILQQAEVSEVKHWCNGLH